jgi:hypothetical protein
MSKFYLYVLVLATKFRVQIACVACTNYTQLEFAAVISDKRYLLLIDKRQCLSSLQQSSAAQHQIKDEVEKIANGHCVQSSE